MMFFVLSPSGVIATSLLQRGELLIGPEASKANPGQAMLRAVLVYGFAVLLVRLGQKRFLGRNSGIDILLSVILGSVLSRGINGSSPLGSTLAACVALVGLHWVFAALSYRFKGVGKLIKGEPSILVEDGQMQPEAMRGGHISEDDLQEAVRIQGKLEDLGKVKTARLERNGEISVIEKKPAPGTLKVLEITVEAGVQTVRVELG